MSTRLTITKEKLAALRVLVGDEMAEEVLTVALAAEKEAEGMGLRYKQAQPAGPLDAALDRLRAALEQARQTRGDQDLVKQIDAFTATFKPQAAGGPKRLGDSEKPEAERTKAAGPMPLGDLFDAVFDGTTPNTFKGENWS